MIGAGLEPHGVGRRSSSFSHSKVEGEREGRRGREREKKRVQRGWRFSLITSGELELFAPNI